MRVTLAAIMTLKGQMQLEDNWLSNNKEPEYTATILDLSLAVKDFKRGKTILTHVREVTSVPLVYVIRQQLICEEEDEDPTLGGANSKYTSHDQESIARSSILTKCADLNLTYTKLEADGPFVLPFLINSKKVWAILHTLFSASDIWQHVKKFASMQNGRCIWRTLHIHFLGGGQG